MTVSLRERGRNLLKTDGLNIDVHGLPPESISFDVDWDATKPRIELQIQDGNVCVHITLCVGAVVRGACVKVRKKEKGKGQFRDTHGCLWQSSPLGDRCPLRLRQNFQIGGNLAVELIDGKRLVSLNPDGKGDWCFKLLRIERTATVVHVI